MIEANNPEIDVDEIMENIRDEVARRHSGNTAPQPSFSGAGDTGFAFNWSQIRASLSDAEQNADVGTSFLSMRRFNWAIRWLAKLTGRIVIYLTEVITFPQRRFNQSIVQALRIATEAVAEPDNRIAGLEESWDNRIAGLEESWDNRIVGLEEALAERDNRITGLEEFVKQGLAKRDTRTAVSEKTISHLKTSLVLQERRLSMLLEEARKRLPEPFNQKQLQTFTNEEIRVLDPPYFFFEDEFRGTREDIKERLKVYLPLVREAEAGTEKRPILDVGCGRGEWLELLKEEGLTVRGLDFNRLLAEQCQERGMDVVEGDAIEYLLTLPDASLGTVTAFHLIEHLRFGELIKFLDETVRVLKPGGLAIFETPNPENILVGACNFYFDPSHRNPLPPAMIKFMVESRGLCKVQIKTLHPFDEASKVQGDGSELAKRFNDYFYGPQDYAVVGYKA